MQAGYPIAPLKSINGTPVVDWLEQFARDQSFGMVEPDADWNQLMNSPAQYLMGGANTISGAATFYPGDALDIEYENGTIYEWQWLALYNSPGFTGPLATGGDFYNFFVLGIEPSNWETTYNDYETQLAAYQAQQPADNSTTNDTTVSITSWHDTSSAYPDNTIMHQANLGLYTSGYLTGYFLDDVSTAVLSVPTFDEYGDGIDSFSQAVIDFIGNATNLTASKVIIDLQQNAGGLEALAFDMYLRFFPTRGKPKATSRMRSHPLGNTLGSTITSHFQGLQPSGEDYDTYVASEWAVTDRINNATGNNFTSWAEFYGPLDYNQDSFSLIQQYNLSSAVFDNDALGVEAPDCFYNDTCPNTQTWTPDNIILLTDGTCGSTCSLFVELMTQQAGVRTVAVGGRPKEGPMQAASGSRGALAYSADQLDYDFYTAQDIDESATAEYVSDPGMYVNFAGFNLRDQIRPQDSGVPNQFLYLPADCRIYWTLANFNDYNRLWHDVWNAVYNDTSLCVPGSTNAKPPTVDQLQKRSQTSGDTSVAAYIAEGLSGDGASADAEQSLGDADVDTTEPLFGFRDDPAARPKPITFCTNKSTGKADSTMCKLQGYECKPHTFPCAQPVCMSRTCKTPSATGVGSVTKNVCTPICKQLGASGSGCSNYQKCLPEAILNGNTNAQAFGAKLSLRGLAVQSGRCFPNVPASAQCSVLKTDTGFENAVYRRKI